MKFRKSEKSVLSWYETTDPDCRVALYIQIQQKKSRGSRLRASDPLPFSTISQKKKQISFKKLLVPPDEATIEKAVILAVGLDRKYVI